MAAFAIGFWICFSLVAYTYLFYPVLLFAVSSVAELLRQRRRPLEATEVPRVSLIIPAHNEERHLPDKLVNLAALDYPRERLEVIFVSDGSTDSTNAMLRGAAAGNLHVIYRTERGGKATALNEAAAAARHDVLVFSDAATLFAPDAITKLVRHFADPRVGVVCGALRFQGSVESQHTEGVYWRYESRLRLMESRIGVTLTASGAIFAMRRTCFIPLSADTLVDDLVMPMNARKLGFRVLYDPEAIATDFAATTVASEFTRRVRVATGSFRALGQILAVPLDPVTGFAFLSHKVLRWVLPFLLLGMLLTSAALLDSPLYRALFAAQSVFYGWAALGYVFRGPMRKVRYALVAYYLLAIHLAFLVGFIRFVSGRGGTAWRRAQ